MMGHGYFGGPRRDQERHEENLHGFQYAALLIKSIYG